MIAGSCGYLQAVAARFQRAMWLMRRRDPQAREDGFHLLRCWLLELIGRARSEAALPLLAEQLHGQDPSLRTWAAHGLEALDTKAARHELWKARANGLNF